MKKLLVIANIVLCIFCVSIPAQAQYITKGHKGVGFNMSFDPETYDGAQLSISGSYGYFLMNYLFAGGGLNLHSSDSIKNYEIFGFIEKLFPTGKHFVPCIATSLGIVSSKIEYPGLVLDDPIHITYSNGTTEWVQIFRGFETKEDSTSAAILGFNGGFKYFINESTAIDTRVYFNFATDDIYYQGQNEEPTNSDIRLGIGLSYYF